MLAGVIGALASLPLIKVDVSVRAAGLVRPQTERADLRPAVSGHIAAVLVRDNDRVRAGQPLLVLRARDLDERLAHNLSMQRERTAAIHDLKNLTTDYTDRTDKAGSDLRASFSSDSARVEVNALHLPSVKITASDASSSVASVQSVVNSSSTNFLTPAFQQEHTQLLAHLESYHPAKTKARNELARYTTLSAKGIATQQELDNARYEAERLEAEIRLLIAQTLSRWQTRLRDEQTAQADLISGEQRLREEATQYTLRAPVDGVLVGFTGWSTGGFVAAGQSLGAVSPEDALQVETYVSPRDIGLVRVGQPARIQIDAYPYTQWGTLDGTVIAISGDLNSIGAASGGGSSAPPVFKVLIRPAAAFLTLPNGVRGELKKGLTLSARFLVARRSLLQIFYQDVSAWLDPKASST